MNKREASICARLKLFRETSRLPMAVVASELNIGMGKLAGLEYGQIPLRFELAARISERLGVSLRWLAEGVGLMRYVVKLPDEILSKIPQNALFSAAYDAVLKSHLDSYSGIAEDLEKLQDDLARMAKGEKPAPPVTRDSKGHPAGYFILRKEWIPAQRLRAAHLRALGEKLVLTADDIEAAIKDSERQHEVDEIRASGGKPTPARLSENQSKDIIDTCGGSGESVHAMSAKEVPTWAQLKKTIAKLTAGHGHKAALADELGVSRQVLGNWLSDGEQGAPNAELTLRLFKWSLDPKRQQPK